MPKKIVLIAFVCLLAVGAYFRIGTQEHGGSDKSLSHGRHQVPEPVWPPAVRRDSESSVVISNSAAVAVSPDGNLLALWGIDPQYPWFGLYSLTDDNLKLLPLPPGRVLRHARWAPDSRYIVAASTEQAGEAKDDRLDLVDSISGEFRPLIGGTELRGMPFFSRDGKTIYYFKGRRCVKACTSVGGHYGLFRLRGLLNQEEQLTPLSFYHVASGDESSDGKSVIFSGMTYDKNAEPQLYSLQLSDQQISALDISQKEVGRPRVDDHGRIYFSALSGKDASGGNLYGANQRWQYSVFLVNEKNWKHAQRLFDLEWQGDPNGHQSHLSSFDIDRRGYIFHCISALDGTRCVRTAPFLLGNHAK